MSECLTREGRTDEIRLAEDYEVVQYDDYFDPEIKQKSNVTLLPSNNDNLESTLSDCADTDNEEEPEPEISNHSVENYLDPSSAMLDDAALTVPDDGVPLYALEHDYSSMYNGLPLLLLNNHKTSNKSHRSEIKCVLTSRTSSCIGNNCALTSRTGSCMGNNSNNFTTRLINFMKAATLVGKLFIHEKHDKDHKDDEDAKPEQDDLYDDLFVSCFSHC